MDIQIWLIPLLSLVGGAGGAAFINTAYGMKKQKQDRIDEHARWRRDRKLEAYVEFMESTRLVLNLAVHAESDADRRKLQSTALVLKMSPMKLLAPAEVNDLAETVRLDSDKLVDLAMNENLSDDSRNELMNAEHGDFSKRRSVLAKLCREDLDGTLK